LIIPANAVIVGSVFFVVVIQDVTAILGGLGSRFLDRSFDVRGLDTTERHILTLHGSNAYEIDGWFFSHDLS